MLNARVYNFGDVGLDNLSTPKKSDILGGTVSDIALNVLENNYLSFDGNGVELLDNTLKFYEKGDEHGYILTDDEGSQFTSNADCSIGIYPYVNGPLSNGYNCFLLKRTDEGEFPSMITIYFYGNCCREMVIAYGNLSDGIIKETKTVTVSDEEKFVTIYLSPKAYSQIAIYFTKTVLPNQCIRFNSIFDGTVNIINQFTHHSLVEEINVLSDDLPINQFECSVSADVSMININTPLMLYNNHKCYGKYYVQTIERSAKNIYDIVAQDVLCLYDNVAYRPWMHYALSGVGVDQIVLNLESLTNSKIELTDTHPDHINGVHADGSCRYTLCELAYNFATMVYSARTFENKIRLIKVPTSVSSVITNSDQRIIGEATYKKNNTFMNAERKRQYIGVIDDNNAYEIQSLSGNVGDVIELTFDKPTFVDGISGVAITEQTLFLKKIVLTSDSGTIRYAEYPTGDKIDNIINSYGTNNEIKSYSSFLTYPDGDNSSYARDTQLSNIQKYISSQGTVTAKIRLRDEKVGDLIQIETAWDGVVTGIITKMTISFGYEDIADIEVLQWNI